MRKHFQFNAENFYTAWPIKDCRSGMLYVMSKDQQSSPCGPVVVTIFDSDRKLLYFSRCGENRAEKQSKAGEKMSP